MVFISKQPEFEAIAILQNTNYRSSFVDNCIRIKKGRINRP